MAKRQNYAKPICHACNRPFDPSSPGATRTMGPTCAKRAVFSGEAEAQLSFGQELGSQSLPSERKHTRLRRAKPALPAYLQEQYRVAKMAFDELFREFCRAGTLLYGEKALAFEQALSRESYAVHGLDDPLLDWLEPEHELQLFLSMDGGTAFHRRSVNGTVSLLHFKPGESESAKRHIACIVSFTKAIRAHRDREDAVQLSLFAALE